MKKYLHKKEEKIKCEIQASNKEGKKVRYYLNVNWRKTPKNTLKPLSLKQFDKKPLNEKLKEIKKSIEKNRKGGYAITIEWLYMNFDVATIDQAIKSGLLQKNSQQEYEWY